VADAVLKLAYEVSRVTEEKVALIEDVMRRTGVLALNARLEAARAGEAGSAFSVVAQEMNGVASDIRNIARQLREAVATNIEQLRWAGSEMHFALRGERLADLALNAVEIMDRNLYERSCDIRWWATDIAMVEALTHPGPDSSAYARERLATILRSYTVYLDLWIADRDGRVVATGRPDLYRGAIGVDVSDEPWFRRGLGCSSGDDFAVCDIARNPHLGGAAVATYSTAIRAGGRSDGERLGVMGIFFDWAPQAATIVQGLALSEEERKTSRVMLLSADHHVLAASDGRDILTGKVVLETEGRTRGWYRRGGSIIAFARTPGYETYQGLGWYGCIEAAVDAEWDEDAGLGTPRAARPAGG